MNEKKHEAIPAEEVAHCPRGAYTKHEALLDGLQPRQDGELEAQLTPPDHALLPRWYRVRGRVLHGGLVREQDTPPVVQIRLAYEVVLGNVLGKVLQAAELLEHTLSHQTRHACHAVDSDQIDEQVHAAVARAEVDLLEGARETGPIANERHLMHQAHFFGHSASHVVQCVFGHLIFWLS